MLRFEYIPWVGHEKVEEETVYGSEAAARTYFNGFKGDPRFLRVSLIREVTDRQIVDEHGSDVVEAEV